MRQSVTPLFPEEARWRLLALALTDAIIAAAWTVVLAHPTRTETPPRTQEE